jgi:hypothetical protein
MVERIERMVAGGAVRVDLLLCVCERVTCGWSWVVPHGRGVPKACSKCKVRTWNASGAQVDQVQAVKAAPSSLAAPVPLDVTGPPVPASGSISRGKATTTAPTTAGAGLCRHGLRFCAQCRS